MTHSGYFRLETILALGMGIADGKLLTFHGISEESVDKKISTLEYNNRAVYDCFDNTFEDYFDSPALNLSFIIIDDRHCLHKRSQYNPDLIPAAIFLPLKFLLVF